MTAGPPDVAAAAAALLRPRLRGWLHAAVAPLALAAGIVLVVLAPTASAAGAAAAFAGSAVVLFTTSAIYHRRQWPARADRALRRLDHANIFVLIAGTYTPFAVLALSGTTRTALLVGVWSTALAGVVFRTFWVAAPRWSYVPLYLGLGWAAALVFPQLLRGAGVAAFALLAAGGLCYTAGGFVYGLRRPNPSPRWFGFHEVFHSLTIAGFVCQYVAASIVVYHAT